MTLDPEWAPTAHRWLAAEAGGRDFEAEAELGRLFRATPRPSPADDLEERIWRATRWVRRRALITLLLRRAGVGLAAAALAIGTIVFTLTTLVPLLARSLVSVVAWLVRGGVWLMLTFTQGLDTWSFLARVGGAVADAIATPRATMALIVFELIGALALYVLNRVLTGPRVSRLKNTRGDLA